MRVRTSVLLMAAALILGILTGCGGPSFKGTLCESCGSPTPPAGSPSVTSLSPSTAIAGGPSFTLTVIGSNFTAGETLCKTRALSEYLLYGHFVQSSQSHFQAHEIKTESLAFAYWDAEPLNAAAVISMVEQAPTTKVALCIESFSNTPVSAIRLAVGLSQVEVTDAAPAELAA